MRRILRIWLLPLAISYVALEAYCGDAGSYNHSERTSGLESVHTSSTTTSTISSVTGSSTDATCRSRTVNYITHTLPQQCLRTDRIAGNAAPNSTASETSQAYSTSHGDGNAYPSTASPPSRQSSALSAVEQIISQATATSTELSSGLSVPAAVVEAELEDASPLDNANFLSFEEWKKQNLAKSGQSPENVGQGRNVEGLRERPGINNALDSFGEEGEIDLDFSGFGGNARPPSASSKQSREIVATDVPSGELAPVLRSKDAGKTCKERTNYASFDCAATVLKSNPECKSASSVLVENKDNYMLNTCSAKNKFFIIELCDDILIDTIVLANYEFFSSIFRHFRVSVSDRYPVKIEKWKDLGTFEARNAREVQAFLIERPQIWARYLRIEFLTHYGSEYYCPVSLLRVHGTTMLEDYRHQEEVARGDNVDEEAVVEPEATATPTIAQEPALSTDELAKATLTDTGSVNTTQAPQHEEQQPTEASSESTSVAEPSMLTSPNKNVTIDLVDHDTFSNLSSTCAPSSGSDTSASSTSTISDNQAANVSASTSTSTTAAESSSVIKGSPSNTTTQAWHSSFTVSSGHDTASSSTTDSANRTSDSRASAATVSSPVTERSADSSTIAGTQPSDTQPETRASSQVASPPPSSNSSRQAAPSSGTAHPQPPTQESFFKSVNKRLQQLESNSTLSLQYIEEQSRILRDAFSKVEKRQITATSSFLSNLNSTVMTELHGFRQAYDQLWQSTVIELEGQREQYQRDMLAMSTRLTLVADELVWQKRMGIVQSTLLLLCLGLVLFARQGNAYLEMPLMQQMVTRSQAALRAGWESPPASPSPNSRSPVSLFRRKLWRSSTEPGGGGNVTDEDSRPESKEGPEVYVAPPTPGSSAFSDGGDDGGDEAFEDVWESRSGPATPTGTREGAHDGMSWESTDAREALES